MRIIRIKHDYNTEIILQLACKTLFHLTAETSQSNLNVDRNKNNGYKLSSTSTIKSQFDD